MKIFFSLTRYVLAFMLVFFGLNMFFEFKDFYDLDGFAAIYIDVMQRSYIFPSIGGMFLVSGSLLLINRMVALAMILTFPIAINALLFHMTLDPANMQLAIALVVLHLIIMFERKGQYANLFK